MKLLDIIGKYPIISCQGSIDKNISGIEHNSNKITKDNMFIAQKGFTHNGHIFIGDAVSKGANTIVIQEDIQPIEDLTIVKVRDTTDALGYFSSKFYRLPWRNMETIGITGTNGKTSTSYYIKEIFDVNENKVGLLGTIGAIIDHMHIDLDNTTPDSLEIQRLMKKMIQKKIEYCIMEVSSHALDLKRVKYMDFHVGIFTNLSREHLDYHKNMENYFNSKLKLFYKTSKYNIINVDDYYSKTIIDMVGNRIPYITYGIKEKADVTASNIKYGLNKTSFILHIGNNKEYITLNQSGEFNVYNALAAAACTSIYGIKISTIKEGLENVKSIKGRFELLPLDTDFNVIIDFAHTPESLKEVLISIDKFAEGRVIVVFGAGGNRDQSKRAVMGEIVGNYADFAIITSDNPRFEEPEKIIHDIVEGINKTCIDYVQIVDRVEAIEYAIKNANPKDIILLTGKGHEEHMIIGNKKYPFNEREIILNIINNRKK